MLTFFEQLILPFLLLIPMRTVRLFAAVSAVLFQLGIVATGNYAWINFIGALPTLACLDDEFLSVFFSSSSCAAAAAAARLEAGLAETRNGRESGGRTLQIIWKCISSAANAAGQSSRGLIHATLFFFILSKSAAPLKELYGPAPWLKFYDDYFFVNAQGVFGFINRHRPTLVLSYTHDELPFLPTDNANQHCHDQKGVIGKDDKGRELSCAELAHMCSRHPQMPDLCPRTCGMCMSHASAALSNSLNWNYLEFGNLPGNPYKSPW